MNPQDPLLFLPEELFGSIQLFLPPSSRAISSRTSQSWRRAINGNLTLHQEIDLSHLYRVAVNPFKVIHYLHHLASRSSNTLVKVDLYLEGFDEGFEGGQQDWKSTLLSIPFMILLPSSSTLKSIRLQIVGKEKVLLPLIIQLRALFQLKRLEIDGPFSFFELAATNKANGKEIYLEDGERGCGKFPIENTVEIMRQAREFVGAGLSSFICSGLFEEDEYEVELGNIVQELYLHSRLTLQTFRLSSWSRFDLIPYSTAWNSWSKFPNLSCLAFSADASNTFPLGRPTEMIVPTDLSPLRLKLLSIKSRSLAIDWKSLVGVIGDELEDFDFQEVWNDEDIEDPFHQLLPFISSLSRTLKTVSLRYDAGDQQESYQQASESQLFFPALEILKIYQASNATFRFFTKAVTPRLRYLKFFPYDPVWEDVEDPPPTGPATKIQIKCLEGLLKASCKTLVKFRSSWHTEKVIKPLKEGLTFPLLEELSLPGKPGKLDGFGVWFSQFHYPKLRELQVQDKFGSLKKPNMEELGDFWT